VVLKAVDFERQGANKTKGSIGVQNNTKGAKTLNHSYMPIIALSSVAYYNAVPLTRGSFGGFSPPKWKHETLQIS